jgi:hypothetical protein
MALLEKLEVGDLRRLNFPTGTETETDLRGMIRVRVWNMGPTEPQSYRVKGKLVGEK